MNSFYTTKRFAILLLSAIAVFTFARFGKSIPDYFITQSKHNKIYKKGWIDLNKNGKKDIYEDPTQEVEVRIQDLLSQMTVEEKTCQLATLYGFARVLPDELPTKGWDTCVWKDGIGNIDEHLNGLAYHTGAVTPHSWPPSNHAKAINEVQKWFVEETRLGIPVDFTNEGIRGLCHDKSTCFPAQIGVGASWNLDLINKIGHITGREAKLLGYTNVYSPILDLARDPRWGRTVECYGEDPYLVSQMGLRMIQGIQSEGVAATAKHFAMYSMPKGGRDGECRTDPHVAPRELHQMYLAPFKIAVVEGKVMSVMSSYNDYDGVPVSGSHYFLTELLRDDWGFSGYVVSDSWAVGGLHGRHFVADNFKECARQTLLAGLNVRTNFSPPEDFIYPVRELLKEGAITMEHLDKMVADVLRVKFQLGLFDEPYRKDLNAADAEVASSSSQDIALKASREAMVLLKNNGLLPLKKEDYKKVLVCGPAATDSTNSISRYGPSNIDVITVLEGLETYLEGVAEVNYAKGCDFYDHNWPENELYAMPIDKAQQELIDNAVAQAQAHDLIVVVVGDNEHTVGEGRSRSDLGLPGNQLDLVKALHATGKPVVAVLINGRPLTVNWMDANIPSILEAWFPGQYGGQAVAEVLYGEYNPGGKLPVTFPRSVGQIPFNFPAKPRSQYDQPAKDKSLPHIGNTRVGGALYPFGYGLSYTTFEYSNLEINKVDSLGSFMYAEITFEIQNTGKYDGDEVVQLYFNDKISSVVTYEKELRGFKRIHLKQCEKKMVSFRLLPKDLSLLNIDMEEVMEPGEFEIFVGSSSEDIQLKASFFVK
jgi:beta-glucosidase